MNIDYENFTFDDLEKIEGRWFVQKIYNIFSKLVKENYSGYVSPEIISFFKCLDLIDSPIKIIFTEENKFKVISKTVGEVVFE